jgi:hypothetical protein
MKFFKKILNVLLVMLSIYSFGQNNHTNLIPIKPNWEINDIHTFKIKFFENDVIAKKSTKNIVNFNASFKVLEKNDKNYLLAWTFDTARVTEGKPNKETLIISKLLNNEILIKFSQFGEYIGIVNDEAIRLTATKIIDSLITQEKRSKEKLDLNVTKQLITSKEGLETAILKICKIYFLPFGHQYPLNQEMTYNLKYPNILGGNEPFDAIEKVTLKKTDNNSDICVIEASQVIDTKQFLKEYRAFLKKKLNYIDKDIETLINKEKVEIGVKENLTHHFDLKKGCLLKLIFKRVIDMSILTKTIGYEVEIIN